LHRSGRTRRGRPCAGEVAEELFPLLVGRHAVLLRGPQRPAAVDESTVAADHLLGVDGLVAHGRVDVPVSGDELGDVRRHSVQDRVGDEHPAEVVEGVAQRPAVRPDDPDLFERVIEISPQRRLRHRMVLEAAPALEQQWHRCVVDAFVLVVGDDEGDAPLVVADSADDRRKHVGELGRDDEKALGVGLRRGDLQQRDELSARRQAILDEAVVAELGELLDADAGVAQHLDRRPGPKGPVLLEGEVAPVAPFRLFAPDAPGRLRLQHRAGEMSRPPR
jgi:hypothetical protein